MKSMRIIMFLMLASCGQTKMEIRSFETPISEKILEGEKDETQKLINAVKDDNLVYLKSLDWKSLDPNQILPDEKTFLFVAFEFDRLRTIRFLRSQGAQNDLVVPALQQSLLDLAGTLDDSQGSLKKAITVDLAAEFTEFKLLIEKNNFKEIKKYIDDAIDLNQLYDQEETVLTYAIKQKKLMALRALLMSQDLDVNLKNTFGQSPLEIARQMSLKQIESELIKRGAL